jgi:AcrR family transcriptional regulator
VSKRKYDRLARDDRRHSLIEATLRCLMREGREGLSTRKISAEAGISIGLINHHFRSKDDLVAAAYETMAARQLAFLKRQAESAGPGAEERLRAYLRAFFGPQTMNRNLLRAWIVFWAMSFESPKVRVMHDRTNARSRALLESLLAASRSEPGFDARPHAIELSALLDGLWLEWCLDGSPYDADDGRRICERWVDRFLRA